MNVAARIMRVNNSHNLRLDLREGSPLKDPDVLLACGMTNAKLGRALLSLRSEWDGSGKPLQMTESDWKHIAGQLRSRHEVIRLAEKWAADNFVDKPLLLAMKVTVYWIDNGCPRCFGRGRTAIPNTPTLKNICRSCCGSGKQREPGGDAGRDLLAHFGDCETACKSSVGRWLR